MPNGKVDRHALAALEPATRQNENYIAPRDYLELQMARLWEDILGVQPVGMRDNFFDLGGHSLSAVKLMACVARLTGQSLPLTELFKGPTIEDLARTLRGHRSETSDSILVQIQSGGNRQPFFCVHPVGGNVFSYVSLARQLGDDQSFYGLQSPGLCNGERPLVHIDEMATHYIRELRSVRPFGPYLLGGWSMGGVVAFEMAQRLEKEGEEVALLALFDVLPPLAYRGLRGMSEAQYMLGFARDLGLAVEDLPVDSLQELTTDEQLSYLLRQAELAGIVPPGSAPEQAHRLFRVYESNSRALSAYECSRYKGSVTLFRAREGELNRHDEYVRDWAQLVEGGVEIHEIPGNHYTMFREPHVRVLAELLKASLDSVQTQSPAIAQSV